MPHSHSNEELTVEGFLERFGRDTDEDYLRQHFDRFALTRRLAWQGRDWTDRTVLDIGAHWLHQSALWAMAGSQVIAMDLPDVLDDTRVQQTASAHSIRCLPCQDLAHPEAIESLAESSVDLVLFCEIIEHLTFNPIAFWRGIHRVLKPGGLIVITTPNYYSGTEALARIGRYLAGRGAGISVEEILGLQTTAHHWKEFSMGELVQYFEMLSPDFQPGNRSRFSYRAKKLNWKGRLYFGTIDWLPPLRSNLYLEVLLANKDAGIVIEPQWA